MQKFVICFGGVPGSSKSPIINHLSPLLNLPVFSNDQLRYEIREDLGVNSILKPEALSMYDKRVKEMRNNILASGTSFIYDCSVDRKWPELKEELKQYGYKWFVISLDFSKSFMTKLYESTGRLNAIEELDIYNKHHQDFIKEYDDDIFLHLTDENFAKRVQICLAAVETFVNKL